MVRLSKQSLTLTLFVFLGLLLGCTSNLENTALSSKAGSTSAGDPSNVNGCIEPFEYLDEDGFCYLDCVSDEDCDRVEAAFDEYIESLSDEEYIALFPMTREECFEFEYFDDIDSQCYCDDSLSDSRCEDLYFEAFEDLDSIEVEELSEEQSRRIVEEDEGTLVSYRVLTRGLEAGSTPMVDASLVELQEDRNLHAQVWNLFKDMFPRNQVSLVDTYIAYSDGPEETLAFVHQTNEDLTKWALGVDVEDAKISLASSDMAVRRDLVYTLIHEYGHLVTLDGNNQLSANTLESECNTYHPGEGCMYDDAYLFEFVSRYWNAGDIDFTRQHSEDIDSLYEFYETRSSNFVTDYAATNPEEDIAESWTYFILQDSPDGNSVADDKVRFFYEFDEWSKCETIFVPRSHL